jgi:hypothetical protein
MHLHTRPRCHRCFQAPIRIVGLQCRPCIEKRDEPQRAAEDSTPTRPAIIISLRELEAAGSRR